MLPASLEVNYKEELNQKAKPIPVNTMAIKTKDVKIAKLKNDANSKDKNSITLFILFFNPTV